jgi:glycosyltransferase involved in cell wall biosynthesis
VKRDRAAGDPNGDALRALSAAHHETRQLVERLERRLAIDTVMRWVAHHPVDETTLVSVITPTRNRCRRLPDAVDSVLAQTYRQWELVVVDDGSTDDTAAYLAALAEREDRVNVLAADGLGACRARNRALEVATGDVIVYLDDDNRFDEQWLRSVVWAFSKWPDTTWLYAARVIDDLRKIVDDDPGGLPEVEFAAYEADVLARTALFDLGVMAHRRDADVRFSDDVVRFGDWDLALQLAAVADPLELPVIAVYYSTAEPDRLSGTRNAYFLDEAQEEAERIRRRHAGSPRPSAGRDRGAPSDR